MSIMSGSVSFKVYRVSGVVDPARFAEARPQVDVGKIGKDPVTVWSGTRYPLDPDLSEESIRHGSSLVRVDLVEAARKVPAAMLKAEVAKCVAVAASERGVPFLNRAARNEIKAECEARLASGMPVTCRVDECVFDLDGGLMFTTAMSDKRNDSVMANVRMALGVSLIPVTAETECVRPGANPRGLGPTCFSPCPEEASSEFLGRDFLTWLWFKSEHGGLASCEACVEGPITLSMDGDGAHEATLRRGLPTLSREAKAALAGGKKLRKAKLRVVLGDDEFAAAFDADDFSFRGAKLPKLEPLDARDQFVSRAAQVSRLARAVAFDLFREFLAERTDSNEWEMVLAEMRDWVQHRKELA